MKDVSTGLIIAAIWYLSGIREVRNRLKIHYTILLQTALIKSLLYTII